MIISGDQIEKRNQVSYFQVTISRKKNPLALRARILKLFWKGKKLKSLFHGINLKRGHQMRYFFLATVLKKKSARASRSHTKTFLDGEEVKLVISGDQLRGHQIRSRFALAY